MNIVDKISKALSLQPVYVEAVLQMLDEGNTIPFIARYRKEKTGAMDDQTLRKLSELLERLRSLDKRRCEILRMIAEQQLLDDELAAKIDAAQTLAELEDLYRPFKKKKKTRASAATERGLGPLADLILSQKPLPDDLESIAAQYISDKKGVLNVEDALQGARDIVAEHMSNDAECHKKLRNLFLSTGIVETRAEGNVTEKNTYEMYAEYSERISRIPDHRVLAINRGERDNQLKVKCFADSEAAFRIMRMQFIKPGSAVVKQLEMALSDAWNRLISPSLSREMRSMLTDRASTGAVELFGKNLHQLLMQPPVKGHVTLGIDPGYRTGCKLAVVDAGGKVLQTGVAHFTIPQRDTTYPEARRTLREMILTHGVTAIAIGNGTASRESEAFVADLLKELPAGIRYAIVSEAGASVYSASELGAQEFPDFDVSLRSAVSIARRLQDPLAELVKIDPKSIGVGQYQHDLRESELNRKLEGVVEDCVNAVGVELSTASPSLLAHVAGIGPALARNIVAYREEHGFESRAQLKKVPKLGAKAFEQAAGFLRLADSANVLDATAVHPESYPAAQALLEVLGFSLAQIRGGAPSEILDKAREYGMEQLAEKLSVGVPTLQDILSELVKPGRDPRDTLPPTVLRSDVLEMKDLLPGMKLKGTVRNVIDFGAFVDIGVHQDGLVHISRMANRYIRHPSEAVKVGDVVDVWVLDVDEKRKRISLTMVSPEKGL
ncbi:MAG: Tex family protein [Christensenellales bacterium]|nr:Tex family protein [Christensenellales bacterium]